MKEWDVAFIHHFQGNNYKGREDKLHKQKVEPAMNNKKTGTSNIPVLILRAKK